jgi:Zn-finger domain-containing protein
MKPAGDQPTENGVGSQHDQTVDIKETLLTQSDESAVLDELHENAVVKTGGLKLSEAGACENEVQVGQHQNEKTGFDLMSHRFDRILMNFDPVFKLKAVDQSADHGEQAGEHQ